MGESVNIVGLVVSRPGAATAMCAIIAEDDLKARGKRKLFGDLAPAPAGGLGNSVNIASQPARAVQFPDPDPFAPMISLALAE